MTDRGPTSAAPSSHVPPADVVGRRHEVAFAPVIAALLENAARRAEAMQDSARAESDAVVAAARREAVALVRDARRQGVQVAARVVAIETAAVRRQAREIVLGARRDAYEAVRREAIDSLNALASTPEGSALVERLRSVAVARLGACRQHGRVPAVASTPTRTHTRAMRVEAVAGPRRVELDPTVLVDDVLATMAEEIESLWA